MNASAFVMTKEVRAALGAGRAVVALESSVITHGLPGVPHAMMKIRRAFPYFNHQLPLNLALAQAAESAVRRSGAVPATIAVLKGQVHIGLTEASLVQVASARRSIKISTRDLGVAIAQKAIGGTTVAATSTLAALAGIRVFSTGGIGGVHRGWTSTLDISADLGALARTGIVVVSSGAKAILDLPATLEAIESLGIPAVGYKTDRLPQFTAAPSVSLRLPARVNTAKAAAEAIAAHTSLLPRRGFLLFNPCPKSFAIPAGPMEADIVNALEAARRKGIRGAQTTPFLLSHLAASERGAGALSANIALLLANAQLAADVAVALSKRR